MDIDKKMKGEINHLKTYDSSHIIKYFDDFIEDQFIYVVLEYCPVYILNYLRFKKINYFY